MAQIGQPKAEAALTECLLRTAADDGVLCPPDATLVCVEDAELGTGRPDLIFLALDIEMLEARRRAGPRLPNLAHARVLGEVHKGEPAAYTRGHVRRLSRNLTDLGWTSASGDVLHTTDPVAASFVVEAKVSDWHKGIGQLVRYKWCADRAALLVPDKVALRVPRHMLRHNGLGLLAFEGEAVSTQVRAPESPASWVARQWTVELAVRAMEHGRLHVLAAPHGP